MNNFLKGYENKIIYSLFDQINDSEIRKEVRILLPPTGFHGLVGLIGSSNIDKDKDNERIAFFFGSVFPDIDIFGSVLIFLIGYMQGIPIVKLRTFVVLFHRSATHSIILILFLIILGYPLRFTKHKTYKKIGNILLFFGIGITIHILFDFFYLDGVSVFWPFITERIYLPIGLPILEQLPNNVQKFYSAIDIAFDGIYWFLFARLLPDSVLNNEFKVDKEKYLIRKRQLMIGGIIVVVLFSIFSIFGLLIDFFSVEEFVVIIYFPGIIVLFISCFIPIFFRKIIPKIDNIPQSWFKIQKNV